MTKRIEATLIALLVSSLAWAVRANAVEGQGSVGSIEGSVRSESGSPLAAVVVLAGVGREVGTGPDGGFRIDGLAPGAYRLEARSPGHVIAVEDAVEVRADEVTRVTFTLVEIPIPLDEVVVTARYTLLKDEPIVAVALDREEIRDLPHFGDDLYRAVSVLPGVSASDFSARFNVRGGLHDEVLVRLDGLELFEPFHLKDFQGVFNILDPEVIGAVDLIPGSFPAEYGDRMSGVLDMTTVRPSARKTSMGISFSNAWVGTAGSFADGKGRWLGSARRGYLDMVLNFVSDSDENQEGDREPDPRYWDAFGKLDYDLSAAHSLSVKALASNDSLDFEESEPDEDVDAKTSYGNATVGVEHLALLGSKAVAGTLVSFAHVDGDRDISAVERDESAFLQDRRDLDTLTLLHDWNVDVSSRHYLKGGFEIRRLQATYDYFNDVVDNDFIADPRFPAPVRTTRFEGTFDSDHHAVFAADRVRIGQRLTAEIGVRYDRQSLTDDAYVSPRLNLVYDLGGKSVLRAGWGHFYQSQRPHELGVQFGETTFDKAQRAEHLTVGFERALRGGSRLRLDAYLRQVRDPHRRYETLFEPFSPFPEASPDLVRIAPDEVHAEGVELFFRGSQREKLDWWLTYAYSVIEDELENGAQYRSIDQTHAFTVNANYRPSRKWNLSWVWTYHTGWPRTDVSAHLIRDAQGLWQTVWDIGPFYDRRHPAYHRLDLRASRSNRVGKGRLTFFLDVQNLYDRDNVRGIAIDERYFVGRADGAIVAVFPEENWFGIMPSFGISYER